MRRTALPRSWFVALVFALTLFASWGLSGVSQAYAEGTFLPQAGINDVLYDDARSILYLTNGGGVQRYDVVTGQWLTPLIPGKGTGGLLGMDLSPDGKTLAVCDAFNNIEGTDDGTTSHFFLIDVDTGAYQTIRLYPGWAGRGGGTWSVAYGYDGTLLVSTSGDWQPLRRYDPRTGIITVLGETADRSDLSASGDRTIITWAESDISDGRWGIYRVVDGNVNLRQWYTDGTSHFNFQSATSRDGKQSAILGGLTASIYENGGASRRDIGSVIGAKYSPTADLLYLAQYGTSNLNVYNPTTLSLIKTYNFEQGFGWNTGGSWGNPRLTLSRDNGLIVSEVTGGFRYVRARPMVMGTVRTAFHSAPVQGATVELWRQRSGAWSLEATTVSGVNGSWSYATDDTSTPLRVHVTDPSGIGSPAWYGGSDVNSALDLTPSRLAPPTAPVTLAVATPGTISGVVRSAYRGKPVAGAQVVLYGETADGASLATVTADASGAYSFTGLGASTYRIGFSDPTGKHPAQFYDNQPSLPVANSIRIDSAAVHSADATLAFEAYRIIGTVKSDFHNAPVAGAVLEFWRDSGHGYAVESTVAAAADGTFSYSTDATSSARIRVVDPSGAADPVWFGGTNISDASDILPTRGTPPSVTITMPLAHPASLQGVVRSTLRSQAVAGATVTLYQNAAGFPSIATTTTAADGSYRFDGLGSTGYKLGFADPSGAHGSVFYKSKQTVDAADLVSISAPGAVSVDATMPFVPTYVGGTAVSSFAAMPIAGVQVEVWRYSGSWQLAQTVVGDAAGAWSCSLETTDPVRVHFIDPNAGHLPLWYGGTTVGDATDVIPVRRAAAAFTATMQLAHGATVLGTAYSSWNAQPLPGLVAVLYTDTGTGLRSVATTTTAANGTYSFSGIASATVYVQITDPSGAHVANDYASSPILVGYDGLVVHDVTLQRIDSGIGGTVVSDFDNGQTDIPDPPIASAGVELYRKSGGVWARVATLTADPEGIWHYQSPDPSAIRVRVTDPTGMHSPAWYGGGTSAATAKSVVPTPVPLGETNADITMPLTRPAAFHGVVRDAVTGTRLGGIGVVLFQWTGDQGLVAWAETASDGSYSIPGIPPGDYGLAFTDDASRYELQYWPNASSMASATAFAIRTSSDSTCDAMLQPHVVQPAFDPVAVVAGSQHPAAGQSIRLSTYCYDNDSGDLITDAKVVVQVSHDLLGWATDPSVAVTNTVDGSCEATVSPSGGTTTFYRFAALADEFHKAAQSDPLAITPSVGAAYFSDPQPLGAEGWNPFPGMQTGATVTLRDDAGGAYGGKKLELQSSANGSNWAPSGVPVIDRGAGDYEAGFAIAGNVWSRFKWDGPSGTVYSAPFVVTPQRSSAWMFRYGIGDVGKRSMGFGPNWSASLPAEVRTTAPVQVLGTLLVQTTQDGLTWVNAQAGSRYSTYAKSLSATAAPTPLTWDTYFTTVNTTLRLAWQANDWSDATASGPMTYLSWAPASTPKVAYKQSTRRKVVVTGKTPGPNVIVTLFRLKGRTWRKTGTYRLTNRTGTPGAIPYSLRLKLGKGKYAVRATNGADSIHTESPMSGMGLFLVK